MGSVHGQGGFALPTKPKPIDRRMESAENTCAGIVPPPISRAGCGGLAQRGDSTLATSIFARRSNIIFRTAVSRLPR